MKYQAEGTVHLMLGVAASRIRNNNQFRYCPLCVTQQLNMNGEAFWQRDWYLPALPYCPQHGELMFFNRKTDTHRHLFWPIPYNDFIRPNQRYTQENTLSKLTKFVSPLFLPSNMKTPSPSFEQWTLFYQQLAQDLGLARGKKINHEAIANRVKDCFSNEILSNLNLKIEEAKESCWLKSIFRKHRKTFNYLQHSIVWQALVPKLNILELLQQANSINVVPECTSSLQEKRQDNAEIMAKRTHWQQLVQQQKGVLKARKALFGRALYAWLYRYDRTWLLTCNQQQKSISNRSFKSVNWAQRDRQAVRKLIKKIQQLDESFDHPKITANWLLKQQPNGNLLLKNLSKLPLVRSCLERYTENVTDYQIRRLCRAYIALKEVAPEPRLWIVLRSSGLSVERMTAETKALYVWFERSVLNG